MGREKTPCVSASAKVLSGSQFFPLAEEGYQGVRCNGGEKNAKSEIFPEKITFIFVRCAENA